VLTCGSSWKTIGDPDAPAPMSEPGMDALFKEIRTTVSQEAQIVKAVFPSPFAVMEVFLQRVFAQVVSSDRDLFGRSPGVRLRVVF
jgi:hypothetical protein